MINIYSDNQQSTLKYLKDIEVNLSNVLIMTGDFNIKDNNWDLSYPHYSIHTDTLKEIANSFNLGLSTSINQVSTKYTDNPNESNSVIDLMFLWINSEKINTHLILLDLQSSSNHALLTVNIIVNEIQNR